MKKQKWILFILLSLLITCIPMTSIHAKSFGTPYYTYTSDKNQKLIQTSDAYIPSSQLYEINGERFSKIENIFLDQEDFLYITDSLNRKVYILDSQFQYVTEITSTNNGFMPKSTYVTQDKVYVVDFRTSSILIYDREELLVNHQMVLLETIGKPDSPIFDNGYKYKPENIAVDPRGNIYIESVGSQNGLIMLDEEGDFMTFFGGNALRVPLQDQIRALFLSEKQKDALQQVLPDYPTNLARDRKGFIYTVTSSITSNPVKKFNVAGRNYFNTSMIGTLGMVSIWIGAYNNVFTINTDGLIFEYDTSGNLLFVFGGKDVSNSRDGLLSLPVSIAANSNQQLFVADQGASLIQIYDPTDFTKNVHSALDSYQKGDYEESLSKWQYILQYNALFDYAHIGIGDSYLMDKNYHQAYHEYQYASDFQGMSNAFWGIRQEWLKANLSIVLLVLLILLILRITYGLFNKRYEWTKMSQEGLSQFLLRHKLLAELLYVFPFLKHPFNGFYDIKVRKKVSVLSATILYFLLAVLYVLNYQFANVLFVPKVGVNVSYNLMIMVCALTLWVISNYLICSINGEGTFKDVYQATAYTLSPILVLMPFLILLSNGITYQEQIFYQFGYTVILLWVLFLFFFMIKDIHNYGVKETLGVILKSLFTMLIIGLILFLLYTLFNQMMTIIGQIITEVRNR